MATALLIIHGLIAVALLGAITHQTLATWAPPPPGRFILRPVTRGPICFVR